MSSSFQFSNPIRRSVIFCRSDASISDSSIGDSSDIDDSSTTGTRDIELDEEGDDSMTGLMFIPFNPIDS